MGNSRDFFSFKNKGAIGREYKSNSNNLISFQINDDIIVLVVVSLVFLWVRNSVGRVTGL